MAEIVDIVKELNTQKTLLKRYKQEADKARESRIRNEATLKQLEKNESDIVDKIKNLGYDPDNLKAHMEQKINELKAINSKLAKVMPDENGVMPKDAKKILGIEKRVEEPVVADSITPVQQPSTSQGDNLFEGLNFDDIPM